MNKKNQTYFLVIILVTIFSVFLVRSFLYTKHITVRKHVGIILAPHFDDAVLSLGGYISTDPSNVIVATFFTGLPTQIKNTSWDITSGFLNDIEAHYIRSHENDVALSRVGIVNYNYLDYQYRIGTSSDEETQRSIEEDIKKLIKDHSFEDISVYGPSYFGDKITHPDHYLLHKAFYQVAQMYKGNSSLTFFFYEDFPYVSLYMKKNSLPLPDLLATLHPGLDIFRINIYLNDQNVEQKIDRLSAYSSQLRALSSNGKSTLELAKKFVSSRCLREKSLACEVVYQIK